MDTLLDMMLRKTNRDYKLLLDGLCETGQGHIVRDIFKDEIARESTVKERTQPGESENNCVVDVRPKAIYTDDMQSTEDKGYEEFLFTVTVKDRTVFSSYCSESLPDAGLATGKAYLCIRETA